MTWQGTGVSNKDFPHGESIYAGIRAAVTAAGGTAELNVAGDVKTKPDGAIVVFGENPYAEFQGDIPTAEFSPGAKPDLALLRKLHASGIPVVAVFLSGRPLWVNPEINASDAFIAAWLPGSEGGGIADVVGAVAGHENVGVGREWQQVVGILQKNEGFAYGLASDRTVLRGAEEIKPTRQWPGRRPAFIE